MAGTRRKNTLSITEIFLACGLFLLLLLLRQGKTTSPQVREQTVPVQPTALERQQKKPNWREIVLLAILTIVFSTAGYLLASPSRPFYSVPVKKYSDGVFYFLPGYSDCDGAGKSTANYATDDITYTININFSPASSANDLNVTIRPSIESKKNPKVSISCIGSGYIWPGEITPLYIYGYGTPYEDRVGTHISSTGNTSAPISFVWHNGIQQIDLFRRRIFLQLANYEDPGFSSQYTYISPNVAYSIVIDQHLDPGSRIVFRSPKSIDSTDYNYTGSPMAISVSTYGTFSSTPPQKADGDYEVVFETPRANIQRDLFLVITGVVLGLAGNFLTSLILALFRTKE